jgi:2'-5' RNA ligase
MRLFVAIELPDAVRKHLLRLQDLLRPIIPARWTQTEQLHLTLKFLGETPDEDLPRLIEAMRNVAVDQTIQLQTQAVVYFPTRGPLRIVAVAMEDVGGFCAALQQRIDQACHDVGFRLDNRRFAPHITLARVKQHVPADSRQHALSLASPLLPGPIFDVDDFSLMESHLDQGGPVYTRAAHFEFL